MRRNWTSRSQTPQTKSDIGPPSSFQTFCRYRHSDNLGLDGGGLGFVLFLVLLETLGVCSRFRKVSTCSIYPSLGPPKTTMWRRKVASLSDFSQAMVCIVVAVAFSRYPARAAVTTSKLRTYCLCFRARCSMGTGMVGISIVLGLRVPGWKAECAMVR